MKKWKDLSGWTIVAIIILFIIGTGTFFGLAYRYITREPAPVIEKFDCDQEFDALAGCWHWRFSPKVPVDDDWDFVLLAGGTMFCEETEPLNYKCKDEIIGMNWNCVTNKDLSEIVCTGQMYTQEGVSFSDSRMIASMFQEGYYWGDVVTDGKQFIAWRP